MRRLTLALATLSLACGSTEPPETAPDLTGTYTLLSLTSPELANGATLKPPVVDGTLEFAQYTDNGERAIGDASYYWELEADGEFTSTGGSGTYRQEANGGPISMKLNGWEYLGSYALDGDTLALNLEGDVPSAPVTRRIPRGKTVWVRDDSQ